MLMVLEIIYCNVTIFETIRCCRTVFRITYRIVTLVEIINCILTEFETFFSLLIFFFK